jgi:hypothetical protein
VESIQKRGDKEKYVFYPLFLYSILSPHILLSSFFLVQCKDFFSIGVMKRFFSCILAFIFFFPSVFALDFSDPIVGDRKTKFPKTFFQQIEQQHNGQSVDGLEWRNVESLLEREQKGGMPLFSYNGSDAGIFDVLSGRSSMDDALQIGDFSSGMENKVQFLENIKDALENYKRNSEEKEYPEHLEDFRKYEGQWWAEIQMHPSDWRQRKSIADIADLVEYKRMEQLDDKAVPKYTYELSIKPLSGKVSISDIQSVETKSHDFEGLLLELKNDSQSPLHEETLPKIYAHIPADTFSVYFSESGKYRAFSQTLANPLSEIRQMFPLPTVSQMEEIIGKRLGIGDPKKFLGAVHEFAFVGEDIRIFPSNDFALLFKCKLDVACDMFGAEKIGDYFALATNKKVFHRLEGAGSRGIPSLRDEKDFEYAWRVTDSRRNAFLFFSDRFIRKMVSPEYRIALRRQESVIEAMNVLQYISWLYKKQENIFPKTLQELEEKKYIPDNILFDSEKYSFDEQGIIRHAIWGSPFDITPVTQVKLSEVFESEKEWYETKRDVYQSNYRKFFDPIGVSIVVSDKILFHTVILPLSDSKEYQILRSITGNVSKEYFDLLRGNSNVVVEGVMGFDIDRIIYEIIREVGELGGVQEFLEAPYDFCLEELGRAFGTEVAKKFCDLLFSDSFSEEEKIAIIGEIMFMNETNFHWEWGERLLDFFGDEIAFHLGTEMFFDFDTLDMSEIDASLSVKLKDRAKAEKIFIAFFKHLEKEGVGGISLFKISGALKNEYNGEEYYIVPTGFVNLYAYFEDDRVSFAISQKTINGMIDGEKANVEKTFQNLDRFLGGTKNVFLRADTGKIGNWIDALPQNTKEEVNKEMLDDMFSPGSYPVNKHTYEAEYSLLENILGETFMKTYFTHYPVKFGFFADYSSGTLEWKDQKSRKIITKNEIFARIDILDFAKKFLSSYGEIGLSFGFTPHGAEIKVAFDNVLKSEKDDRFSTPPSKNNKTRLLTPSFDNNSFSSQIIALNAWQYGLGVGIFFLLFIK